MPRISSGALPGALPLLWDEFLEGDLEHPEIRKRQKETKSSVGESSSRVVLDYWTFVDDAIRGVGGFQDGAYIFPHAREIQRGNRGLKKKAAARIEMADYDNFPGVIAEAPWGFISQSADMIKRDAQNVEGLSEFWQDVDGNKTAMLDFSESVYMQARAYGTGFVRMDRPAVELRNEDENKGVPVVLRHIPTSAFRWWNLDRSGNLVALVYYMQRPGYASPDMYLWDLMNWSVLTPETREEEENYIVQMQGDNPLADRMLLPFARLHDTRPTFGEGLGQSIMLNVAKIARQVYNTDSEIVEQRRQCAFPIFAVPMKSADPEAVQKMELGTASAFPYDGDGGEPKWVAPELEAMKELQAYREKKKEQAFGMAHMAAITGYVQTSSGFHAEAEFDKTQRRIGRSAASLEAYETEILELWAAFRGVEFDSEKRPTVQYPREFGIRDLDKVYDRTGKRLGFALGQEDTVETLRDFYQALYPRRSKEEIESLAKAGAQAKEEAREMERAQIENERTQKANKSGDFARKKPAGGDRTAA